VGLLAAALARLFGSAFFALGDTRTPFRCAATRMILGSSAGFLAARFGPGLLGLEPRWGLAGLTLASGLAGWVEFALLRRELRARIGAIELPRGRLVRLWLGATAGAAAGWIVLWALGTAPMPVQALASLGAFGSVYLLVCRKP
jgi:putative peptidoglycan lipid II flippase